MFPSVSHSQLHYSMAHLPGLSPGCLLTPDSSKRCIFYTPLFFLTNRVSKYPQCLDPTQYYKVGYDTKEMKILVNVFIASYTNITLWQIFFNKVPVNQNEVFILCCKSILYYFDLTKTILNLNYIL